MLFIENDCVRITLVKDKIILKDMLVITLMMSWVATDNGHT